MLLSLVISYYIFLSLLSEKEKNISQILFYVILFIFACLLISLSRHPAINLIFVINFIFLCIFLIKVLISQNHYLKNNIINVLLFTFIVSMFTINYHFNTKFEQNGISFNIPPLSIKYFSKIESMALLVEKIKNKNDENINTKEPLTIEDLLSKISNLELIIPSKIRLVESNELKSDVTNDLLIQPDDEKNDLVGKGEEISTKQIIKDYIETRNIEINKSYIEQDKELKDKPITEVLSHRANDLVSSQKDFIKNLQFLNDSSNGNPLFNLYNSLFQPSPIYILKYS